MWADSLPAELQGSPRILEWVAYRSSRGSPWPRNRTGVSCLAGSVPAQLQGSPSPLSSLSFKAIFHWNLPPLLLWGSTLSFSHQTPRPFYLYVVCYSVWNLFMFHGIRYNVSFFFKCFSHRGCCLFSLSDVYGLKKKNYLCEDCICQENVFFSFSTKLLTCGLYNFFLLLDP